MDGKFKWFVTSVLVVLSFSAHATDVDRFATAQGGFDDTSVDSSSVGGSVGHHDPTILGGNRDLFANLLVNSGFNAKVSIGVRDGRLFFTNDALTTGSALVQWDGIENTNAIDATGLGGIDLTSGGTVNSFQFEVFYSDYAFELVLKAWEDETHWTAISFYMSRVLDGPTKFTIPFEGFTNAALCGSHNPAPGVNWITCSDAAGNAGGTQVADLTNLGALELTLDPNGLLTAFDAILGPIEARARDEGWSGYRRYYPAYWNRKFPWRCNPRFKHPSNPWGCYPLPPR